MWVLKALTRDGLIVSFHDTENAADVEADEFAVQKVATVVYEMPLIGHEACVEVSLTPEQVEMDPSYIREIPGRQKGGNR